MLSQHWTCFMKEIPELTSGWCSVSIPTFTIHTLIALKLILREGIVLQTHILFSHISPYFSRFSRVTFAFSPYLLAPMTRNHQMLKSPHSPDPLASWVPCVLQCASCSPHSGLTNHTWRAALHMFTSWLAHAHCLPRLILMVSFSSITWLYWYTCYPHVWPMKELCNIAYRLI